MAETSTCFLHIQKYLIKLEVRMEQDLASVTFHQKLDGSWQAVHEPSGKVTHGIDRAEAHESMAKALEIKEDGGFGEPPTSDRFDGVAKEIALHLEGAVSQMLKLHSGYARLEAYQAGIAQVKLGGGCRGCPSSLLTLSGGVKSDLQHKFGEDVIVDVIPVME